MLTLKKRSNSVALRYSEKIGIMKQIVILTVSCGTNRELLGLEYKYEFIEANSQGIL